MILISEVHRLGARPGGPMSELQPWPSAELALNGASGALAAKQAVGSLGLRE